MLVQSLKKTRHAGLFFGGLPSLLGCALRVVRSARYRAGVAVDFALQFAPLGFAHLFTGLGGKLVRLKFYFTFFKACGFLAALLTLRLIPSAANGAND